MKDKLQVKRWIETMIPSPEQRGLVLLTGARQTGKTTAARSCYANLSYFNLDAVEYRDQLSAVSSFAWGKTVGNAVFDEIQKEPALLDKIKYAYDEQEIDFSALLGSAQILLLKNVRETLAGRVFVFELFPLMLSELSAEGDTLNPPLIEQLLVSDRPGSVLQASIPVLFGPVADRLMTDEKHLLEWGGMPGLLPLDNVRRRQWLKSYEMTYLERDLGDLARLDDLKPFRRFQKLAALRSGNLLSFSELARDAGVAVETARRYLEYLRLSYQAFLIQPFAENLTSQVVKTPKIFWADCGLCRSLTGRTPDAPLDGHLFETYVAGELTKLLRTKQIDAQLFYYRTRSGMEVDFLLQTSKGIIAIEVKNREQVDLADAGAMRALASVLGERWLGGLVVYRGSQIQELSNSIWAVPSARLFS
jgi:predicted AAA+ superfamily ATPase